MSRNEPPVQRGSLFDQWDRTHRKIHRKLKRTAKERRMAAQVETLDLTKEIADSGMYSYDRPAYTFWNGAAQALAAAGYENDTVIHILKSKVTRWMLDAGDEKVVKLGRA